MLVHTKQRVVGTGCNHNKMVIVSLINHWFMFASEKVLLVNLLGGSGFRLPSSM